MFLPYLCWRKKISLSVFIYPFFPLFVKKKPTFGGVFIQKHGTFLQLEVPFNADYNVSAHLYLTDYLPPEFTSDYESIFHVYPGRTVKPNTNDIPRYRSSCFISNCHGARQLKKYCVLKIILFTVM